jgi:hypothetical protein
MFESLKKKQFMKIKILLGCICLQLSYFTTQAQPVFHWADKMGSPQQDEGAGIALDPSGNVYTTGIFEGTCDFDPSASVANRVSNGGKDFFISKLDNAGNYAWAKSIGANYDDYAYGIAADDSGNVYVTGYFGGNPMDFDPGPGTFMMAAPGGFAQIFVLKLNTAGDFVWAKQIGASSVEQATAIAVDHAGHLYLTGYFMNPIDFDPGPGVTTLSPNGAFVLKLDTAGNFKWAKQLGDTAGAVGYAVKADKHGNVYTAGAFYFSGDFDPGAAAHLLTNAGDYDIFVSKLDSAGNFVWAQSMGGTGMEQANALAVDTLGNVYLTGGFHGTCDFDPGAATYPLTSVSVAWDVFTEKLDVNGDFLWAFRLGSTSSGNSDQGYGIQVDDSGNVYTTGCFLGNVDFDPGTAAFLLNSGNTTQIYIHKVTTNGNFTWAGQMGGGTLNYHAGKALALDSAANIYTTGSFVSVTDFDPGSAIFNLTSSGGYDIFVQKLGAALTTSVPAIPGQNSISLYPNPNNGEFKLLLPSEMQFGELMIVNTMGQKVYQAKVRAGENTIFIPGLAAGLYSYLLTNDNAQISTGKIVIE